MGTVFPGVTFGIIVLNGEPFTRYCLRSLYPFAREIIVIEGASERAAAIATPDGHSTDGTLEVLHEFRRREDPEGKLHIVTRNGFWSEKDEQSQAYAVRATSDYLWQVDIDEFYRPEDMSAILEMLRQDPEISGIAFRWKNFWGGFDYLADGWKYRDAVNATHGIRRVFRWGKGYRYASHRPPTVLDDRSRDLRTLKWIGPDEMARRDIYIYHYGMVFPKQAREKTQYYMKMWDFCAGMDRWEQETFRELRHPFAVIHALDPPTWLERFRGTHPPEIRKLLQDLASGAVSEEQRETRDIEKLVSYPPYLFAAAALKRLYGIVVLLRHAAAAVCRQFAAALPWPFRKMKALLRRFR